MPRAEVRLFVPDDRGDEITVADVVAKYLAHLRRRVEAVDYNVDAFGNISRELTRFADAHDFAVAECRQHDLTKWLELNPAWESGHTKKRIIAGILACFRWAADEELIERCPYRRVKLVSEIPYKARRPADPAEYVALMRGGSRPLRRALFFLRRTGARSIEMREMTWAECFLDGTAPHVSREKSKTKRKTGKPRKIGLDAGTVNFLRALRRREIANGRGGPADRVFVNCEGRPWKRRAFCQHLRRWAERLGLDDGAADRVTAYCLRHAYTVDGIEAGLSTRKIADQLGHETTGMIDRIYGSHTRQRHEHLANVAAEIICKRVRVKSTR